MKKVRFAGSILLTVLLATSCSKNESMLSTHRTHEDHNEAKTVMVESTQLNIKLVNVEGFDDPCFNISLDNIEKGNFRFTGSTTEWTYVDLQYGLHVFSYSCLHTCDDDTENGSMVFQIDDGKTTQTVSVVRTNHCRYDFKIQVK